MAHKAIVVGDPTTGGGTVITGSPFTDIDGKPVARITDQATCPKCKGVYPIVTGDLAFEVDGQPIARHGDSLACGCKVLSAQQLRISIENGSAFAAFTTTHSPPATLVETHSTPATPTTTHSPPTPSSTAPSSTAPASGNSAGTSSSTTPSGTACWVADHNKAISVQTVGRYFEAFDKNNVKHTYNIQRRYKVICPLQSGGNLRVEVKFKVEAQAGVTEAEVTAAKTALETGVATHWNGKLSLAITDAPCGTKTLPIEYKIVWVTTGEDYTIKIHSTYPREGVTGFIMDVSKTTAAWIYAHEFGHCVGVPDEYSYTADNETVRYYKPDGVLDATVISAPPIKSSSAADATIMSSYSNTTVLPRHAWGVAREVQELLTAEIGRPIQCNVI
ncbi:MAG: PAAR domain-containing protein [Xanthomonadaceae bacterium]|nr:PAAR domain-containing protein [Xanthomonadaceae bacterium]